MQGQPGQSAAGNRNQREQTTTGQSERNLNQAPSAAQAGRNAPQGHAQQSQSMGQSRQGAAQTTQQAQGVSVTPQQRTRIRETVFASNSVPRVDNVNFAVRVGTTVPSSVHLVVVPETLIEIYPQWRDDEYFVVRDEVVIVDHSHRIVAVVPTGSSSASSSSSESAYASSRSGTAETINLSQDEIRQLQITLNQRGFNVGEPDGVFGCPHESSADAVPATGRTAEERADQPADHVRTRHQRARTAGRAKRPRSFQHRSSRRTPATERGQSQQRSRDERRCGWSKLRRCPLDFGAIRRDE